MVIQAKCERQHEPDLGTGLKKTKKNYGFIHIWLVGWVRMGKYP